MNNYAERINAFRPEANSFSLEWGRLVNLHHIYEAAQKRLEESAIDTVRSEYRAFILEKFDMLESDLKHRKHLLELMASASSKEQRDKLTKKIRGIEWALTDQNRERTRSFWKKQFESEIQKRRIHLQRAETAFVKELERLEATVA